MLYVFPVILIFLISVLTYFFCIAFVRKENVEVDNLETKENEFLKPYHNVLKNGMDFIDKTPYTTVNTVSFDGLKLSARYFDQNSKRTILLFHGYRSSARHDFSCAVKMYYDKGFNILLVDQRSHGLSEGRLITFGVKESRDVISWVEFLNTKFNPEKIVLSGLSMGATTVLLSLRFEMPENVKCVIADCGFTSPEDIIKKVAKQTFKINATPFIPLMDLLCKVFGKFSIRKISTVDTVKNSNIPVLLIHGESDNFVPCEMSKTVSEICTENTEIVLVKNADHGVSFLVDTDLVMTNLDNFFEKNLS